MAVVDARRINALVRELTEVGIAASVVGTGRSKINGLAVELERIAAEADSLRPEVATVTKRAREAVLAARRVDIKSPRKASAAYREMADVATAIGQLVRMGLVGAVLPVAVSWWTLDNEWGYTEKELAELGDALGAVADVLKTREWKSVVAADVLVGPSSGGPWITYMEHADMFHVDPERASADMRTVFEAVMSKVYWELPPSMRGSSEEDFVTSARRDPQALAERTWKTLGFSDADEMAVGLVRFARLVSGG